MNETATQEILRISSEILPRLHGQSKLPVDFGFSWPLVVYGTVLIVSLIILFRLWRKHPEYKLLGQEDFHTFRQQLVEIVTAWQHFDDGITGKWLTLSKTSTAGRLLYWLVYFGSIALLLWFLYRILIIVLEMRVFGML